MYLKKNNDDEKRIRSGAVFFASVFCYRNRIEF